MACPTCGDGGEYYRATPLAEARHFAARVVWALHRMRQALDALGRFDRAREVGALISLLEGMREDTNPGFDS